MLGRVSKVLTQGALVVVLDCSLEAAGLAALAPPLPSTRCDWNLCFGFSMIVCLTHIGISWLYCVASPQATILLGGAHARENVLDVCANGYLMDALLRRTGEAPPSASLMGLMSAASQEALQSVGAA
jgi:hypothetical protein